MGVEGRTTAKRAVRSQPPLGEAVASRVRGARAMVRSLARSQTDRTIQSSGEPGNPMQMLLEAVRKWRRRRSPAIALNGAAPSINGCGLATLADYEAALGAHSRKLDAPKAKNTLYFWDRAGIVAYAPLSSDRIASFTAYLAREPSSVSPKTRFAGSL